MAYERRLLNPQAPEYVPILHKATHPSPLHFPRYPPPPYFAATATVITAQPPFHVVTSFHPAPPQAMVAGRERSSSSSATSITAWRPKISTSSSFGGGHAKGAEASGSGPHHLRQKMGNWALGLPRPPRRPCSNKVGNGGAGGEGQVMLKKHGVLPLRHSEEKTTVMIKNIPKQYSQELLLKFLDKHCMLENQKNKAANDGDAVSAFDFMYLPIDFRTGGCKGYAFVNFTSPVAVWKFYNACNWKTWDLFQSPKIREIVCALIQVKCVVNLQLQGKEALVNHFERSMFWCESDEFLPVCFSPARDGSGESVEENRVGRRIPKKTKAPNPIQ